MPSRRMPRRTDRTSSPVRRAASEAETPAPIRARASRISWETRAPISVGRVERAFDRFGSASLAGGDQGGADLGMLTVKFGELGFEVEQPSPCSRTRVGASQVGDTSFDCHPFEFEACHDSFSSIGAPCVLLVI